MKCRFEYIDKLTPLILYCLIILIIKMHREKDRDTQEHDDHHHEQPEK